MKRFGILASGLTLGLAIAGVAPAIAGAPAGDAAHGKAVFARCAVCHDLNTGATRIGPSLKGVIGRAPGTYPGFRYTDAMKAKKGAWDAASLDVYLTAPMKIVPGTSMTFPGLPNAQDRADVIAYLKQAAH